MMDMYANCNYNENLLSIIQIWFISLRNSKPLHHGKVLDVAKEK